MGVITYIQIFATFWCSMLLTLMPGLLTYKQFALISAFVSAFVILFLALKLKRIPKTTVATIVVYSLLIILYYLTPSLGYRTFSNEKHSSLFLALVGQVFPAVITASLLVHYKNYSEQIKKATPFVSILFSIISLYTVLFHQSMTSGGYILDENNLNYQSITYLAAFASALAQYSFMEKEKVYYCYPKVVKKALTPVLLFSIVSNLYTIFLAGGRGGFVAYILFALFSLFVYSRRYKVNLKGCSVVLVAVLFILAISILVFFRARDTTNVENSGLERISNFIESGSDENRSELRRLAMISFREKPLLGHGVSSIFYEIGEYSHNCFFDILVESGLFGGIIFSLIVFATFYKGFELSKKDASNILWLYIFLCGFLMSLFSGYYLVLIPMNWGTVYILSSQGKSYDEGQETAS